MPIKLDKANDSRFIYIPETRRYVKIGSSYHAKQVSLHNELHPYSIFTKNLVTHIKILANDKLNDKQKKTIIKMMLKDSMAFKTTNVVQEIKDLFSLDFSRFLVAKGKPEPNEKNLSKSMTLKSRFTLGKAPQTDISDESETDWATYGALARCGLNGIPAGFTDTETESEM